MSTSRRKFLTYGGAAAVVTLGAGYGLLSTPSMSRASAPWLAAGGEFADPRLNALSYAILAPNPHNMQPWQFTLVGTDQIDVRCDLDRRLPHTDPFDRQITIGFGCMMELLRQAAAELGFTAQITPFPDGEGGERLGTSRIASIRFIGDAPQRDPLFAKVLERRSTKEAFTERKVDGAEFGAIAEAVPAAMSFGHTRDDEARQRISANAWAGWQVEQNTDATRRESIDLMRFGNDAVVAQPDGIDMGGTFMSAAHAAGIVTPEALDTPGSTAFESGIDMYRAMVESTHDWLWLTSAGNSRAEQLQAGAAWVRLNLAANQRWIAVHPWSHCLQEFPEMRELYNELRAELAPGGETIQMFARVGYGPEVPASPRWPLEAKLTQAPLVDD